jgi:hypothetical protein
MEQMCSFAAEHALLPQPLPALLSLKASHQQHQQHQHQQNHATKRCVTSLVFSPAAASRAPTRSRSSTFKNS